MNINPSSLYPILYHASHSASESIGTLGSRIVSLFQNRWLSVATLAMANSVFVIASAGITVIFIETFVNGGFKDLFREEEGMKLVSRSSFYLVRGVIMITVGGLSLTVMNSAFTRLLNMPLSRLSIMAIATITTVATSAIIRCLDDDEDYPY